MLDFVSVPLTWNVNFMSDFYRVSFGVPFIRFWALIMRNEMRIRLNHRQQDEKKKHTMNVEQNRF